MTGKEMIKQALKDHGPLTHAQLAELVPRSKSGITTLLWQMVRSDQIQVKVHKLIRNTHGYVVGREQIDDLSVWGRGYLREYYVEDHKRTSMPRVGSVFDLGQALGGNQ